MESNQDNDKEIKFRRKVKEMVANMSTEELSFTLGRYCGPGNIFLSEKKFGFVMPKDIVEKELQNRMFEQAFFETE